MKQRGFTLIEILVALFIFAILSVLVSMGLKSVLKTHRHLLKEQNTLDQLLKTEALMRRDFYQIVEKKTYPVKAIQNGIVFTRMGFIDLFDRLGHPPFQRVSYQLEQGKLIRNAINKNTILLNQVTGFHIQYLDRQNRYYENWPLHYGSNARKINASLLPKAIVVHININHQGEWKWVFPIDRNRVVH